MAEEGKVMYGKRKLGPKAYAEQQARAKLSTRQGTVYGGRKAQGAAKAAAAATAAPPRPSRDENPFLNAKGGRVSVEKLEELIIEDPTLLDMAVETELSHPDKPRKGAIEALRTLEGARASGPRESVMKLFAQLEKRA